MNQDKLELVMLKLLRGGFQYTLLINALSVLDLTPRDTDTAYTCLWRVGAKNR